MQQLVLGKDINGNVSYSIPFVNPLNVSNNFFVILAADTEDTVTVPAGANTVLISTSPGASILAGIGNSALPAIGSSFATGNGQLLPILRAVSEGETLRVKNLTTDNAIVNLTFYAQ